MTALPELVYFAGHIRLGELIRESIAHAPVRTMKLFQQPHETPMTEENAYMLIRWCLERRILSAETSEHVATTHAKS